MRSAMCVAPLIGFFVLDTDIVDSTPNVFGSTLFFIPALRVRLPTFFSLTMHTEVRRHTPADTHRPHM